MKSISRFCLIILIVVFLAGAFPHPVLAQTPNPGGDKLVFAGNYTLQSGETLQGDLLVIAGTAELEEDSLVQGDIVIIGGQVDVYGEVKGSVVAIGGAAYLGENAIVNQDLVTIGGSVQREEGALVRGAITAEVPEDFQWGGLQPQVTRPDSRSIMSSIWHGFQPVGDIMIKFVQALAMAALAAVLALFLLKPMERVSQAVLQQPLASGGLGILTVIVLPALLVVLAITLILIPLSLIGIMVLGAAFVFGWVALGLEVGKRMELMFRVQEPWVPAVSAGVGTLTLSLISSIMALVPCVGWIVPFLVAVLSLGGVVLTLFGTRNYPRESAPVIVTAAPAAVVQTAPTPAPSRTELDALLADAAAEADRVNDIPADDGEEAGNTA